MSSGDYCYPNRYIAGIAIIDVPINTANTSAMIWFLVMIRRFRPDRHECHGCVWWRPRALTSDCSSHRRSSDGAPSLHHGVDDDVFDARAVALDPTALEALERSTRVVDGRLESIHWPIP